MNLVHEAGYLYLLSKELITLNRQLKKLTTKAEKQVYKYSQAETEPERRGHRFKHTRVTIEMAHLIKKHHLILDKMRYHHSIFDRALREEQRLLVR